MSKHRKTSSPVTFGAFPIAVGFFLAAGCTSGEDIIPDAGGSGNAAAGTQSTNGGAAGSVSAAAGSGGMLPTGGAGPGVGGSTTGSSGAGTTAGAGGSAAGSGGAPMEDLYEAVKGWDQWRFEMPCAFEGNGQPLMDGCAGGGDVCLVGTDKVSPHKEEKVIMMGGDPTKVYQFELWARGVIEPKRHDNAELITTRFEGPAGIGIAKGGTDSSSNFNIWKIEITDPPQLYWMNDAQDDTHRTNILNAKFTVQARGQTPVVFKFDNKNTGQIRNGFCDHRKVVEGVPNGPNGMFHDGNFFQLDVMKETIKVLQ